MTEDKPPGGSIWTRPERSARGPAPEHSRAEIASAGIAIADAAGLGAVTMRSVATAIGTGPASLYRYVANRDELLELMADQARGELAYDEESSGDAAARLLEFAREGRRLYLRHPWLLNVPAAPIPGPNAIAFIEYSLAALSGVDLPGPAKLETIGIFSGAVRVLAQTEIEQQRAGQNTARWQSELTAYLAQIAATGQNPHLAAALADTASAAPARQEDDLFERAMARILAALLPRHLSSPAFMPGENALLPGRPGRLDGSVSGSPPADIRASIQLSLRAAMKARDTVAVSALRSVLAAIGNAEAVPTPVAGSQSVTGSQHVAGGSHGPGSAEAERRMLTQEETARIVRDEISEREAAADQYQSTGDTERSLRLRREARAIQSLLEGAP